MRKRLYLPAIFAGVLVMLLSQALPSTAQENRVIKGRVVNDSGRPIQGAEIRILGMDEDTKYSIKTDKRGDYYYGGLTYGRYRVIVHASGYQPGFVEGVVANMESAALANFTMMPGEDHKLPVEMTAEELKQAKEGGGGGSEKLKQASPEVQAAFDSGRKLEQQAKYEEAVREYSRALELDPKQAQIQVTVAEALSKLNKNEEALAAYRKALELQPNDGATYTGMGILLGKMGKTAESQEAFKKAAALNPESAAQTFYSLGTNLVNSGNAAEAAEAFRQTIKADSNYAEAWYQLGICLSGKPATVAEAVKALQKYVQIGKRSDHIEVAKQLLAGLQAQVGK